VATKSKWVLDDMGYDLSNYSLVYNESWVQQFSLEGGGNSKLSYILKNIYKISIGYNKFNRKLQKLGLCTNNKDTCRLYSKYYSFSY
jgi:hypothetical protein